MSCSDHNFLLFQSLSMIELALLPLVLFIHLLSIGGTLLVSLASLYFCIHEYNNIWYHSLDRLPWLSASVSSQSGTASCAFLLLFQHQGHYWKNLKMLAKKSTTKLYHQHYLGPLFHTPENILLVSVVVHITNCFECFSNFPQTEISLTFLDSYFPHLLLSFTSASCQVSIQLQSCRVCWFLQLFYFDIKKHRKLHY